jgi:hypothetical protein
MSNPFDQFDEAPAPAATAANPFDQFDSQPTPAKEPTKTAPADTFGRRLGLGVRDAVEGVAGVPYDAAGWALRKVGVPVNTLAENLDAIGLPRAETDGEKMASAIIQPVASTLTGQGVGRMMAGAASPVVAAVGNALTAQPGTQAVAAGVGGATQEATGSPTAGLVASMAVPFAGAALGRAISPNVLGNIEPARQAALDTLDHENVPYTLAQATGGRVARTFEDTLAKMPGSSGVQARVNDTQTEAFNRAATGRAEAA